MFLNNLHNRKALAVSFLPESFFYSSVEKIRSREVKSLLRWHPPRKLQAERKAWVCWFPAWLLPTSPWWLISSVNFTNHTHSTQIKYYSVCLWGCFQRRLAFEPVKQTALPSASGHHPIYGWPEQNERGNLPPPCWSLWLGHSSTPSLSSPSSQAFRPLLESASSALLVPMFSNSD